MVYNKKVNNILWFIVGILTTLVIVLTFLLLNKNSNKSNVINTSIKDTEPKIIVVDNNSKNNDDRLPIYPKKLPKYYSPEYQQIGVLTSNETDKEPVVLPLYGRQINNRTDRWQYYTATDKNNMMRLPLVFEGRDCEDDVGCKEMYTGDQLTIDVYAGRIFTATVYKKDAPRYFADII
jgi:hypothetical protein